MMHDCIWIAGGGCWGGGAHSDILCTVEESCRLRPAHMHVVGYGTHSFGLVPTRLCGVGGKREWIEGRVIDHLRGNLCVVVPGDCDASAQVRMIWAHIWGRALVRFIDGGGSRGARVGWRLLRFASLCPTPAPFVPSSPTTDAVSLPLLSLRAPPTVRAYMRI